MKKTVNIVLGLLLSTTFLFGQQTETIKVKGDEATAFIAKASYKYPQFTTARVYFKNGDVSGGRFNYDYFKQMMKYIDDKGDTLVIANEADVNFVRMGSDTFFYDKMYYENIASAGSTRLASRTKYKLSHKEKVGAFGISSPTANIEAREAILDVSKYQLNVNEVLVFVKETYYYFGNSKGQFVPANLKNINKLFPGKEMEAYIDQNKPDFKKAEDLQALITYGSKHQ
ncbi:MAG: hypothetical protein JWQ09_6020 [Segetibacter sp.]|nr:hypothetical protein [Segetibacter sp.]